MKNYELLFVLKPTLTDEEKSEKFDFIKSVLENNQCEIASIDDMGVRKLAYRIDKFQRGHYYVIYYKAQPSVIDEILRNLRYTEEVIRFLNIKYENKKDIAQWEKMAQKVKAEVKPQESEANKENSEEKVEATQE